VLDDHLRLCCELYNAALQERRDAWRLARVSLGFTHTVSRYGETAGCFQDSGELGQVSIGNSAPE
jgi:hypothetical protein